MIKLCTLSFTHFWQQPKTCFIQFAQRLKRPSQQLGLDAALKLRVGEALHTFRQMAVQVHVEREQHGELVLLLPSLQPSSRFCGCYRNDGCSLLKDYRGLASSWLGCREYIDCTGSEHQVLRRWACRAIVVNIFSRWKVFINDVLKEKCLSLTKNGFYDFDQIWDRNIAQQHGLNRISLKIIVWILHLKTQLLK